MCSDDFARLEELGWDNDFAGALTQLDDPSLEPGRVSADYGADYLVSCLTGTVRAAASRHLPTRGRPAVGDWVALRCTGASFEIRAVLRRRSAIRRKVPGGESREQVLAANVDTVLIATAIDGDFNPRRIERLLTVTYQGGASPTVLLTKTDLGDAEARRAAVEQIAPGVPILAVSAVTGNGLDSLRRLFGRGRTAVLLGSSGVGKSTLVNRLVGFDRLRTREVHRTGQGRYTSSRRELLLLPEGGVIIDTPGLREIQLWAGEEVLADVFDDIEELGLRCQFSDCVHGVEPGCAVAAALADRTLDAERFKSYRKLRRELRAIEARASIRLRIEERRKWKGIHKAARQHTLAKRRWG